MSIESVTLFISLQFRCKSLSFGWCYLQRITTELLIIVRLVPDVNYQCWTVSWPDIILHTLCSQPSTVWRCWLKRGRHTPVSCICWWRDREPSATERCCHCRRHVDTPRRHYRHCTIDHDENCRVSHHRCHSTSVTSLVSPPRWRRQSTSTPTAPTNTSCTCNADAVPPKRYGELPRLCVTSGYSLDGRSVAAGITVSRECKLRRSSLATTDARLVSSLWTMLLNSSIKDFPYT